MERKKTRYKDKNGTVIFTGDILHVEEHPDKYVGGALDYDGIVFEDADGIIQVGYADLGVNEESPLSMFPVRGRYVFNEEERYKYWKTQHLGEEPPEELWKF